MAGRSAVEAESGDVAVEAVHVALAARPVPVGPTNREESHPQHPVHPPRCQFSASLISLLLYYVVTEKKMYVYILIDIGHISNYCNNS